MIIAIHPTVRVLDGAASTENLRRLEAWVELNRATLLAYWEGEIDTYDVTETLVKYDR